MTFVHCQGSMFESGASALVDPVNCVGTCGKGLALQFSVRFPTEVARYVRAAKRDEIKPGEVFSVDRGMHLRPRYLFFFPTKNHWREPSQYEWIDAGLEDLAACLHGTRGRIESIAIPALGCGLGGLDWERVRPMIENQFRPLLIEARIYGPR